MKKKILYKLIAGILMVFLIVPAATALSVMDMEVHAAEGLSVTAEWHSADQCEYHIPDTEAILIFRKNTSGNGVILSMAYDVDGYLTVPSYVDGYPVVQLGRDESDEYTQNTFFHPYTYGRSCHLTGVTIPNTVKKLGQHLFTNQEDLTEVTIPDSVTSMGTGVFSDSGVRKVTLSKSMKSVTLAAFSGCAGLTEVAIPDSVAKIGAGAFRGCKSLENISLPTSITEIGETAFSGCTNLKRIVIPEGVTKINRETFLDCSSLETITIPASVTSLGAQAFYGTSIKNINYTGTGEQWKKVNSKTEKDRLKKVPVTCGDGSKIVNGITTKPGNNQEQDDQNNQPDTDNVKVGYTTTKNNVKYKVTSVASGNGTVSVTGLSSKKLTNASIPKTIKIGSTTFQVTGIASNAFSGYKKLKTITVGSNVTTVGDKAFYNCTALTTVKGFAKVTAIKSRAFYKCTKLTTIGSKNKAVTLPKVKTIGKNAFQDCKAIKKVSLTSSALTKIGDAAFQGCTSMTGFTVKSAKLASIGKKAFYGDKKLTSVTLKTAKLTSSKIGSSAFKGIKSTCKFSVPSSKQSSYKKILKAKGAGSKIMVKKI